MKVYNSEFQYIQERSIAQDRIFLYVYFLLFSFNEIIEFNYRK